ncbi:hypothetical protein BKA69DRAFT_1099134 [Paraphysoderma sedebokerense]|nr:hypothetical protein BKA69DRAFT_1099134 [Paraphysoderma sedebokerense]
MFYFLRSDPTFPHPIPPDTTYDLNFSIDRFAMRQNTSEKGSGYLYEFSISRSFVEDIDDSIEVKKETEEVSSKMKVEDERSHSLVRQNDVVEIVDMEEDEVRMEEEAFKPSEKQIEGTLSLEGSSSIGQSRSPTSFPTEAAVDGSRKSDIAISNPSDRSMASDNTDDECTSSLPGSPEAMERQSRLEKAQKQLSQELGIPQSTLNDQSSAEDESTDVADSDEDVIADTQTHELEEEMGYGSEESDLWDDGFNDNINHLYGFLLDQNHSTSHSDSSTSSPVKKRRLAQDRSATIEPLKAKIEVTSSTDSGAETDIGEDEPVVGEKDAEIDMDKTSSRQVKNQKDVKGRAIPARRKGGK